MHNRLFFAAALKETLSSADGAGFVTQLHQNQREGGPRSRDTTAEDGAISKPAVQLKLQVRLLDCIQAQSFPSRKYL